MAANWLPPVLLTASGRPVFLPGEIERCLLSAVDLEAEENPALPTLRSGLLVLTSHRILWIDESSSSGCAIPLAAVVHVFHPKKSLRNMFASPRVRIQVSTSPDGRVGEKGTRSEMVTIVMRGKTDPDVFYGRLLEVLRSRTWEASEESEGRERGSGSGEGSARVRMPVVGVSGILRKEQEMWESTDKSLQEAFHDLNALMSKAKEMVQLAENMRQKLLLGSNAQASANDDELGSKQEIQDWLLSVGIVSLVTKESAGALYHQQLSRQVFARITSLAQKPDALLMGISPSDAALTLGIAPALAKEHMLTAESKGLRLLDSWVLGFLLRLPLDRHNILSINFSSDDESFLITRRQQLVKVMLLT
ncbi:vacuolar protein sorting-associated protein 36 isoform X3 [Phoenix dactylifera]|uniref:Vacuolar protein-sorting-associated protein 36 n=1 Tax=Phoenix dactylifera TaxID=42345 RepID=A0A8B8JB78_PHODC|nr:vacuolar protein sorting-associated protein 36 isoform X3 [Phoenix dactylifera]